MQQITDEVKGFFERYPEASKYGKKTSRDEIESIPAKIKNVIPKWYQDLLLQFPIANLPLGIPNDFGQPLLKGRAPKQLPLMEITFYSTDSIVALSDTIFPNFLLFKKKYLGIAEDKGSTGESIFIDSKAHNPSVTMAFHDMGASLGELIQNGVKLAENFSDLFAFGKLTNDKIELTPQNKKEAIYLITRFFDIIDQEIAQNDVESNMDLSHFSHLIKNIRLHDAVIENDNPIAALLRLEWLLYDRGYPLNRSHLAELKNIYEVCCLHIPELVYIEDRVEKTNRGLF